MKIIIEGSKKEIADFMRSAQNLQKIDFNSSYISLDFLVDVLAAKENLTLRYKRKLKSDKDMLRFYLKEHLGIELKEVDKVEELAQRFKILIDKSIAKFIENDRTPTPAELLNIADAIGQYDRLTRIRPGYLKSQSDKSEGT